MPLENIKCKSCRFYQPSIAFAFCNNVTIKREVDPDHVTLDKLVELGPAREICDREGDGIFVHFEPKTPTTGAAATGTSASLPAKPATAGSSTQHRKFRCAAGGVI